MRGRLLALLIVVAAGLGLVACAGRGEVRVSVSPREVTLVPGESVVFTAEVTGASDERVTWSSSGGELAASVSTALFTAPVAVGEHTVAVSSVADPRQSAVALVTVTGHSDGDQMLDGTLGSLGGTIEGPYGHVISVPAGSLSESVQFTVVAIDDVGAPLPDDALRVSEPLRIASSRNLDASGYGTGFIVATPIPPDVDRSTLGMAVLLPAGSVFTEDEPGATWLLMDGFVDDVEDVFVTVLPALSSEGLVVTLVSAAWLAPRSLHEGVAGVARAVDVGESSEDSVSGFSVTATYPKLQQLTASQRADIESAVAMQFDLALASFRRAGFEPGADPFHLPKLVVNLDYRSPSPEIRYVSLYEVEIRAEGDYGCKEGKGGSYAPVMRHLHVCVDPVPEFFRAPMHPDALEKVRRRIYHELLHAVQAKYLTPFVMSWFRNPLLLGNGGFFLEGSARLAERSVEDNTIRRRSGGFRIQLDDPLRAEDSWYKTQDFWAYVGLKRDLTFSELVIPLLDGTDIDASLRRSFAGSFGLASEYHLWARDYVYDHEVMHRLDDMGAECQLFEEGFIAHPILHVTSVGDAVDVLVDLRATGLGFRALASLVRTVELSNGDDEPHLFRLVVTGDAANPDVGRVHFIHPPTYSCPGTSLGQTAFDVVVYPGQTETVYAVVSALQPFVLPSELRVERHSGEAVSVVVSPSSVTLPVNGTQSFTASVTGATDVSVTWSSTCGSMSGSGNTVTYTAPGTEGSCTVVATSNADASKSASASVTVTAVPAISVTIEPLSVTLPVNGSQAFTATVSGAADTSVTWDASCGSISGSGNTVTYEAPGTAGSCSVTATSVADPFKSATAMVTVTGGGSGFEPAPSYITIENVTLAAASGGTRRVSFDISWDESWRGPDRPTWVAAPDNWDAAWVFVKYRLAGGAWQHATLAGSGHAAPAGSVVSVPSDRVGAFVYRSSSGYGTFTANGLGLQWDYVADGVAAGASVEVRPFGIEMVYVPQESFSLGSGGRAPFEFRAGGTGSTPFVVSSQSPIALGNGPGQLDWMVSTYMDPPSGSTSASFPTGFGAFYVMKHELTQGQYVDFLNSLTQVQADSRKYTRSGYRYAITGSVVGSYATSLPHVAMNYASWADGAAFADWAGLRPMTELEFEKAARGPLAPVENEFVWGSTSITQATGLVDAAAITETPTPVSANANYYVSSLPINGPVRAGSFAAPGDSRRDAGTGYYGSLELGGNLWERPVTVGNAEGRAFTGTHGDGTLDAGGNANAATWPGSTAGGVGFRGGSWSSNDAYLQVSNRYRAADAFAPREYAHGWRGVRSAP